MPPNPYEAPKELPGQSPLLSWRKLFIWSLRFTGLCLLGLLVLLLVQVKHELTFLFFVAAAAGLLVFSGIALGLLLVVVTGIGWLITGR